ncbi:essential metalloproteinase [Murmansk poxvirus]|uniref:Metalloendopeptidase n=2 Tax=Chordopoxvirinae TaxID=10241 RepID=A0A223FMR4_9POXV|nr:essential metalloproteinase [Murmansk poxvirus]AST09269.1 essential metalloproteinase [Murmansk poxvirus]
MIVLPNKVRIFINNQMKKDIYVGISNFGFENDIGEILGIAHLLEHLLITFDSTKFLANASTSRSYMSFWCKSINNSTYLEAVNTLISWFFINGRLKDNFPVSKIRFHIKELENEYYFRNEVFHCMDILMFLSGGDLYNGGRIDMMNDINTVRDMLVNRMHRISGSNIVIFVKQLGPGILNLFENTFGTLPSCPEIIPSSIPCNASGKIVMTPSPFYTVMIKINPTLDNILGIMCLYETYHLIDYETIGNQLYLAISFVDETDYENFLRGEAMLKLHPPKHINMNYTDDYLMNIYLNFPWITHDMLDYITKINDECNNMLMSLEHEITNAIINRNIIAIYPNFSKFMYNTKDNQQHPIVVMDATKDNILHQPYKSLDLMKRQNSNELFIRYGDSSLIDTVALALSSKDVTLKRNEEGIRIRHSFSADDMRAIMESETFMKYSKSKPAVMYQYIFLSFFASGSSIDDILSNRESTLEFSRTKNKILFGKNTRYDVVSKSSFVCGIVRGQSLDKLSLVEMMWDLKKKGLIYSMEFTNLPSRKTFYLFTFTIYTEDVYNYIKNNKLFSAKCLVVSKKGDIENFSSLKKDVIVRV